MSGNISLIIPAAGEGARMKSNVRKPFLTLAGRPILHHTLDRFRDIKGISQVILAVSGADYANKDAFLVEMRCFGVTHIVQGGATRTESVSNALAALVPGIEIVLIHDAVRPFVSHNVVHGVIEAAQKHGAAIAAAPVKDTVKRAKDGIITATIPRDSLYLAQTPQGFRREVIVAAYRRAGSAEFTDDAAVVEAAGGQVAVVASTYDNFKITTPDDLALAKAIFASRD